MNQTAPRVLIAASGTGGHLFPAVFIADAIRRLAPAAEILFVGSGRPLEERIIDSRGYRREVVHFVGLKHRGVRGAVQATTLLPKAVRATKRILDSFGPQMVIGVGGYVSVLPVLLAWRRGLPTWVHEAELHTGMANNLLCRVATVTSSAFAQGVFPGQARVRVTGHPVRPGLDAVAPLGAEVPQPRHILVLGGSQGARGVDRALEAAAPLLAGLGVEVWHQSRQENIASLERVYAANRITARVQPFIDDMVEAYRWSHLVVGRSGAGSVAELAEVGRPSLLIPYPHAQGRHQHHNAQLLVDAGKGLLVDELEADFEARFQDALRRICSPEEFARYRDQPKASRHVNAAETIARGCLELAGVQLGGQV